MEDMKLTERTAERSPAGAWTRFIPLLTLILCLSTLLISALRIMGHGFEPYDDALRHVAKVVSGKVWPDILLIRP